MMKLEIQFPRSERKIKLWQLLLAVAVIGIGLGLLPERIGVPILFTIEGVLVFVLLVVVVVLIFKKLGSR